MNEAFLVALDRLQPSQLYISAEKLRRVMALYDPQRPESHDPIPIAQFSGQLVMTDGHTRAFAAWSSGLAEVPVVWDEDELDWEAYEICVQWCEQEGIRTIVDLEDKIVDSQAYQRQWLDRCAAMHRALANGSSRLGSSEPGRDE